MEERREIVQLVHLDFVESFSSLLAAFYNKMTSEPTRLICGCDACVKALRSPEIFRKREIRKFRIQFRAARRARNESLGRSRVGSCSVFVDEK